MKTVEELAALRNLDDAALAKRFSELKRELYDVRFKSGAGQQGVPTSEIPRIKRTIARLKTVARQRGLAIS